MIVVVLFVVDNKPSVQLNSSNIYFNVSYFTFYVESNVSDVVDYQLSNSSNVLMSGRLFPGVVEEYTPLVPNNSVVNLSVWSDLYYFNVSSCNISMNFSHCRTNVFRKAVDYSIVFSNESLSFFGVDGLVQKPFVCFFLGLSCV